MVIITAFLPVLETGLSSRPRANIISCVPRFLKTRHHILGRAYAFRIGASVIAIIVYRDVSTRPARDRDP